MKIKWRNVIETYIDITNTLRPQATVIGHWNAYLDYLRFGLFPMITKMMELGAINWYAILLHDKNSGVPLPEDDPRYDTNTIFVHWRMHPGKEWTAKTLKEFFVDDDSFEFTHYMKKPYRNTWNSNVKRDAIMLFESAEYVRKMLESWPSHKKVDWHYVGQTLHYVGNILATGNVKINMP